MGEDFDAVQKPLIDDRDHVHLPVRHPREAVVSKLVSSLNGVFARRMEQEFTAGTNGGGHVGAPVAAFVNAGAFWGNPG
ncbi:transposase [Streptomyces sp. NPDC050416]|uniref:transposase n=1 Tax=Streptomyces sp. NPDC050416 TaxID=3365611 RepID=UPI0037BCEB1E